MKATDFSTLVSVPEGDRRELIFSALLKKRITGAQAQALIRGEVPLGLASEAVGTTGHGGPPSGKTSTMKKPSPALYGGAMMRELAHSEVADLREIVKDGVAKMSPEDKATLEAAYERYNDRAAKKKAK